MKLSNIAFQHMMSLLFTQCLLGTRNSLSQGGISVMFGAFRGQGVQERWLGSYHLGMCIVLYLSFCFMVFLILFFDSIPPIYPNFNAFHNKAIYVICHMIYKAWNTPALYKNALHNVSDNKILNPLMYSTTKYIFFYLEHSSYIKYFK